MTLANYLWVKTALSSATSSACCLFLQKLIFRSSRRKLSLRPELASAGG